MGGLLPGSMSCAPPEVKKNGWSTLKFPSLPQTDTLSDYSCIPSLPLPIPRQRAAGLPLPPQPSSRGSIPPSVLLGFKKLNSNPKGHMTPKIFLDTGMAETASEGSGFFSKNRLVKVCGGLGSFSLSRQNDSSSNWPVSSLPS
ncbi:hypothetical protein V8E55_005377 [Tylopilus felleus]